MRYRQIPPDQLILRDHLARDRTVLSNERTLLSYIRTALMMLISGVTLVKLFPDNPLMVVVGYLLIPSSLVAISLGFLRFQQMRKTLKSVDAPPEEQVSWASSDRDEALPDDSQAAEGAERIELRDPRYP